MAGNEGTVVITTTYARHNGKTTENHWKTFGRFCILSSFSSITNESNNVDSSNDIER